MTRALPINQLPPSPDPNPCPPPPLQSIMTRVLPTNQLLAAAGSVEERKEVKKAAPAARTNSKLQLAATNLAVSASAPSSSPLSHPHQFHDTKPTKSPLTNL